MKRHQLFDPASANKINTDTALPGFMQKSAANSDTPQTWRETAALYGVSQESESGVFFPHVKIKARNGTVYRGGDDDLTLEEAMKKGIAPQGMRPAWSPEARKRYEACIAPDIEIYKKVVDKINREAQDEYGKQTRSYLATVVGVGTLGELIKGVQNGAVVTSSTKWVTPEPKFKFNAGRVTFWTTFSVATYVYLGERASVSRKEAESFAETTDLFFGKVNVCRQNNPFDMWLQLTPGEEQMKEFIESLRHPSHSPKFLFKVEFKK